jgi:hypothetical protein
MRSVSSDDFAADKTTYLWDVNHGLPELAIERDGAGSLRRGYVERLDSISMTTPSSTSYYHHDGLGSVVSVTSSSGAQQWDYSYRGRSSSRPRASKISH